MKRNTYKKIAIGSLLLTMILFFIYVSDYCKADDFADSGLKSRDGITVTEKDNALIFSPENTDTALIFYPGGKVEYTAYAPLMSALCGEGIMCIIPEMPFNLAVLNPYAATKYVKQYDNIDNWYISGHSLGGAMAAFCFDTANIDYNGLILLGAYSISDISDKDADVLSVTAENDKVLNMEKYNRYIVNLPDGTVHIEIDGGCHSYFGSYGLQKGDGKPEITVSEQTEKTAQAIIEMISN